MIATDAAAGYWVPQRNIIVGYEMRAGGSRNLDYQPACCGVMRRYVPEREVHEIVELAGPSRVI